MAEEVIKGSVKGKLFQKFSLKSPSKLLLARGEAGAFAPPSSARVMGKDIGKGFSVEACS